MGQVHAEQGRFCCERGGGGASSGSHHFSAAFQLPGLDLSADPLPPPVAARIARSRRGSLCSVPTQADRAVGAPGKWVKPSAARGHRHCPQGALSCPAPSGSSSSFTFGDTTFPCFFFRQLPHHEANEHTEVCNKPSCQIHSDSGTLVNQTVQHYCPVPS